jgi:D-tyrosyl-tRNA(Tyr) deacylase
MRAIIQRVTESFVDVKGTTTGKIGHGLLVFLGIDENDTEEDIEWLTGKIIRLRIFDDDQGVMNLAVTEVHGEILLVSQFTLHASTKKGNRPSYIRAARPETAIPVYEKFRTKLEELMGKPVQTGEFGAYMMVHLVNDGPVTIWIDTKSRE